jgi:uncharacterized 2Fe-2S/4Fe-4S cluster protein (DUF4445 family)
MGSVKVTFQPEGNTFEAETGDTLLDVASSGGISISNLCGGQGVCGRCKVQILQGSVNLPEEQTSLLSEEEIEAGYVLSCSAALAEEDVEVWIPSNARTEESRILTVDHTADMWTSPDSALGAQALCKKLFLQLPEPSIDDSLSDLDRLYRKIRLEIGNLNLQTDLRCLKDMAGLLRKSDWKVTVALHLLDTGCLQIGAVEPGDTSRRNFGLAIDIGTTTVVAQLIDLHSKRIVDVEASLNQQSSYGEDVISRMIYACNRDGLRTLTDAVIRTINELIEPLVKRANISHNDITCLIAAGNTIMTHLLLGLEPCFIRVEPYIPTAGRFPQVRAKELGIKANSGALLHCMPCVSSYIGGDITAGVLACGMSDQPQLSALIDVGTNGEIVIGNKDWLVCCSASAGPAFEGTGIKCGMRAVKGSVEKIKIERERVDYETIGGTTARGICGSGLIDLIAELLLMGIIDQSGKFIDFTHPNVRVVDDIPEFVVVREGETESGYAVVITQDDIANLIKSKGAILAAMKVLLESLGMSFSELDNIYVAGGFGAHLNIEKAIFIGLLPDIPRERIRFIGNSALAGARLSLLSAAGYLKAENIARQMTYYELSVHPEFMNEFVAALFLPHTQMDLFPTVKENLARRRKNA